MGWSIATGVCCLVAAYGMTKSDTAIWLPAILAGGVSLSFLLWG